MIVHVSELAAYLRQRRRSVQHAKPKALFKLPDGAIEACTNCHDNQNCPNTAKCCGGRISVYPRVDCPQGIWSIT